MGKRFSHPLHSGGVVNCTTIDVSTDGACKRNPGPAGAGIVIPLPPGRRHHISRYLDHYTNNQTELIAVRIALETLLDVYQEKHIAIYTDSQLVIGRLHKGWKVNTNREY